MRTLEEALAFGAARDCGRGAKSLGNAFVPNLHSPWMRECLTLPSVSFNFILLIHASHLGIQGSVYG